MAEYVRKTKVRPVLIVKALPEGSELYKKYYVGFNEEYQQYVFEFPNERLVESFLAGVGGMQLNNRTCVLDAKIENIGEGKVNMPVRKMASADQDIDAFVDCQKFLADIQEKKLPYLKVLGADRDPSTLTFFRALWERDFWRDRYFKEIDKNASRK